MVCVRLSPHLALDLSLSLHRHPVYVFPSALCYPLLINNKSDIFRFIILVLTLYPL
jgi:hypothetical protein